MKKVNKKKEIGLPHVLEVVKKIEPLHIDLGREDLNKLVEKLNEVIDKYGK